MSENITQYHGDCREVLKRLPDESVHCCVTSPPYFGLRDYGVEGQIGLEASVEECVESLVEVFSEVRRVLRADGTLWLNLGDSYQGSWGGYKQKDRSKVINGKALEGKDWRPPTAAKHAVLKPKDLIGFPWRVAFALQEIGWYLRQDIVWHKPNPMPESAKDRCTKAHEYIFLLSKSKKYYFDQQSIKEPVSGTANPRCKMVKKVPSGWETGGGSHGSFHKGGRRKPGVGPKAAAPGKGIKANESYLAAMVGLVDTRNKRSVWTVTTQPYSGSHFAVFPEKLIEPRILAGCPEGGTVLDPFGGTGTTARVAVKNRRKAILIELNEDYIGLQNDRLSGVQINLC